MILPFEGRGREADQTREFQAFLTQATRQGRKGVIRGDVFVSKPIRIHSRIRWQLEWEYGSLYCTHDGTGLRIVDCNEWRLLGRWNIRAIDNSLKCGLLVAATDQRQRGRVRIEDLFMEGALTALHVRGDVLEDSLIENHSTIRCAQALLIDAPAMDMLTIQKFGYRIFPKELRPYNDSSIIHVERCGKLLLNDGHISHSYTQDACIRLYGGTHVLRDIHIENPGVKALHIQNVLGRNSTIVEGLECSPKSMDAEGTTIECYRQATFIGCQIPGKAKFHKQRKPDLLGCIGFDND